MTLKLTGPIEVAFGGIPATLSYVTTGGTGAYANDTSTGTIKVAVDPKTLMFTFTIVSVLPPVAV
jgi:hypothetical protein